MLCVPLQPKVLQAMATTLSTPTLSLPLPTFTYNSKLATSSPNAASTTSTISSSFLYTGPSSPCRVTKFSGRAACVGFPSKKAGPSLLVRAIANEEVQTTGSKVEERLGIRIERNPSESRLSELGVRSWPKWGCPASEFPWAYDGQETCYLLKGKVRVYPEGSEDYVEFGAGDLVVFPNKMSCTWEVSETVDKHYQFKY